MEEPLLELHDVHAGYGAIEVLHGIDLTVDVGSVLAVLGPNGAGKTTMLATLAGLLPVTSGSIVLAGRRVNGARPDDLARAGLCLVPEARGIFPNLTVHEHLRMAARGGRRLARIESDTFARFPRLADRRSQLAGTLSGGEQQMLALARGLATDPALLVLDELSMGLAPIIVEELYTEVAAIAASGVSILVVEQFAGTVLGVADRAAILSGGRIVATGEPAIIQAELADHYLGAAQSLPPT